MEISKNIENLKKPKISHVFKKTLNLSIIYSKCGSEYKKIFLKKKIQLRYQNFLV